MMSDVSHHDPTQLIQVVGRMDAKNAQKLMGECRAVLNAGHRHLILELSQVQYINSAGLRLLVQLYNLARARGGTLEVANPSERVLRVMQLVGLDSILTILDEPGLYPGMPNDAFPQIDRRVCYCV